MSAPSVEFTWCLADFKENQDKEVLPPAPRSVDGCVASVGDWPVKVAFWSPFASSWTQAGTWQDKAMFLLRIPVLRSVAGDRSNSRCFLVPSILLEFGLSLSIFLTFQKNVHMRGSWVLPGHLWKV